MTSTEKKIFGWGTYELGILICFFFMWGTVFLDRLVMAYLAPMIMPDLGITDQQFGLINTFTTGCYALSAIFLTTVFEGTGKRKKWLILLCLGAGIFAMLGAVTQNTWQLLVTRALVGFCEGPIVPLIFAMMFKISTKEKVALNTGIISCGVGTIAVFLGPIIVTQIAVRSNWRLSFIVAGLISTVMCVILMKVLREQQIQPEDEPHVTRGEVLRRLFSDRNMILCFVVGTITLCGYWTMMLYSTLFFTVSAGRDLSSAGFVVGAMGIWYLIWNVMVPKISDWIGRKATIVLFFLISAAVPFVMFGAPKSFAAVVMYALFGSIPGALFPFFQGIIPGDKLPNYMMGTASGLVCGFGEILGGSVWPAIAGVVAAGYGYPTVVIVGGFAMILGAILSLFFKDLNKRQKIEKVPSQAA
ncbi:MAG: MFS transporter [Firmicutes bacterium]|nr:MFS transporter [Bacillota bacterium]